MAKFLPLNLKMARKEKRWAVNQTVVEMTNRGISITGETIRKWENGITSPGADDMALLSGIYKKPINYFYK